ncbi:MAG: hypothetical protein P1P88_03415, partial [Bacteroidales bacterium]|nr:hypothetical protein [Bacteroidales bacterium]
MDYTKLKQNLLVLLFMSSFSMAAQNNLVTVGGEATGNGGTVSYSIGQLVYTTHEGTTCSVAQGIQQPYEISVISGIEEAQLIGLSISAFPNPTAGMLTLKVEQNEVSGLSYQIFDMKGKLLESKKIVVNEI